MHHSVVSSKLNKVLSLAKQLNTDEQAFLVRKLMDIQGMSVQLQQKSVTTPEVVNYIDEANSLQMAYVVDAMADRIREGNLLH